MKKKKLTNRQKKNWVRNYGEERFKQMVCYWAGKLTLPEVWLKRDNRISYMAYVWCCSTHKKYWIIYNWKKISIARASEFIGIIFHELGHIKYYEKKYNKIKREYEAEKFSLKCLKKYYPKFYKQEVEVMKDLLTNKEWRKSNPMYTEAFDKIKDYKQKEK